MATGYSNHYQALGIPEDAPLEAVKSAWRRAARKYHPDTGGTGADTSAFNQATEAWKVLGDTASRRAYDLTRMPNPPKQRAPLYPFGEPARERQRDSYRKDTHALFRIMITVSLSQAYAGRPVVSTKAEAIETCRMCDGRGEMTHMLPCEYCHGNGVLTFTGIAVMTCSRCKGHGKVVAARGCHACGGEGMRLVREVASVRLPNGLGDGSVVVASMPSGRRVQVTVTIARTKPWRFEDGLMCITRRFSAKRLQKGTTCIISLPDRRKIRVKIPVGTTHGIHLRIPGAGMKDGAGNRLPALVVVEET